MENYYHHRNNQNSPPSPGVVEPPGTRGCQLTPIRKSSGLLGLCSGLLRQALVRCALRCGRKALVGSARALRHLDLDGRDPRPADVALQVGDGNPGARCSTRGQFRLGGGGSGLDECRVRGCSAHCYPLPLALGVQVRQVWMTTQVLGLDYRVNLPPARQPLTRSAWVATTRQALVRGTGKTRQPLVWVPASRHTVIGVCRPRGAGQALAWSPREGRG